VQVDVVGLQPPQARLDRGDDLFAVVAGAVRVTRVGGQPGRPAERSCATLSPEPEEWTPPACGTELRSPLQGERLAYPHDLREGEHGFQVESCSGSHALVRLTPGDDVRYVLDLNALNGHRVLIGSYTSPAMPLQGSLF
jgi:hypothetical protein